MNHSSRAAIAMLMAVLTSACVPWARERPAYADLCHSEFQFKVPGAQGSTTVLLRAYLYDHAAQWSDRPIRQELYVEYPGEGKPQHEFYVQLVAYNKDRQRLSPAKSGAAPVPVMYDSRQAFITFEDGSRLAARPEVFLGDDKLYDHPMVYPTYARPSPYDINSDEVHRRIPKITNEKHYGSVYVVFRTDMFNAQSKWTINLGALQVQGQTLPIPPLELCYQPVKKWIGIEPLMRP